MRHIWDYNNIRWVFSIFCHIWRLSGTVLAPLISMFCNHSSLDESTWHVCPWGCLGMRSARFIWFVFIQTSGSYRFAGWSTFPCWLNEVWAWMSELVWNWVRLTPYRTNPVLFLIRFQYILAHRAKMYWNLIRKSPGFFIWGNYDPI